MKIINKSYLIDSKLNKNIVLISDLHYYSKKDIKLLNDVLNNIKELNPSYICISGDIIDKSNIKDEQCFLEWLKNLATICKVIISIGNHEFYINKHNNIFGLNKKLLKKISNIKKLYLLDNENIIIDNINFIGLTIPIEYYMDINKKKSFYKYLKNININKDYYNVLLSHSPFNVFDSDILKYKNIDLVLCGHMHGGIVPSFMRNIFKNRGLITPNKKLFPNFIYGLLKIENTNIVISSGIKVIPFKILNRIFKPEIVIVKI